MLGKRKRVRNESDYPPLKKNKINNDPAASAILAKLNLLNEYLNCCLYTGFYARVKFKLKYLAYQYQHGSDFAFPDMPTQKILDEAWDLIETSASIGALSPYRTLLKCKILNILKTDIGRKIPSKEESFFSTLSFGKESAWIDDSRQASLMHSERPHSRWRIFCQYFNLPEFVKIPILGVLRLYVTHLYRHPEDQVDHSKEAGRIFFSTLLERLKGTFLDNRANFFRKKQVNRDCYRGDTPLDKLWPGELTSYWIGHATCYMNIPVYDIQHKMKSIRMLTDPVESSLNWILYPRRTEVGCKIEELPGVDVVLITHDHRDHLDEKTLKKLLPLQPLMVVPEGTEGLLEKMGFRHVHALRPGQSVDLNDSTGFRLATINANVARHWSGRFVHDAHSSAFLSYIIQSNALNERDIFFAGDTALLSAEEVSLMGEKFFISYSFQPGGPDEKRSDMESTHQSSAHGLLMHTRLLKINIDRLSKIPNDHVRFDELHQIVKTVYMHNKTFKLGNLHHDDTDLSISRVLNALMSVKNYKIDQNKANLDIYPGRQIYLSTLMPYEYDILIEMLKLIESINVLDRDNDIRQLTPQELCEILKHTVAVPKIGEKLKISEFELALNLLDSPNITNNNALQECINHFTSAEMMEDENALIEKLKTLFDKYHSHWWHSYTREHCEAEIDQLKNAKGWDELLRSIDNLAAKQVSADGHLASYLLFVCNKLKDIEEKSITEAEKLEKKFSFSL